MILLVLAIGLVTILAFYYQRKFSYFRRHGVPEETGYFPFGSLVNWQIMCGKKAFTNMTDDLYYKFKNKNQLCVGYYGAFGTPTLIILDWELAKKILVKDFDHFTDRRVFASNEKADPYASKMLFNMKGESWKSMRAIMTPIFTSGRLKGMVPIMNSIADKMREVVHKNPKEVKTKVLFKDYAMEVIMAVGFGVEVNAWNDDNHIVKKNVDTYMGYDGSPWLLIKFMLSFLAPSIFNGLGLKVFDAKSEAFFVDIISQTMRQRKADGTKKNDLIDLLLNALEDEGSKNLMANLTEAEKELLVISQALLMFMAGFDTTSSSLALTCHFLAIHPDLQEKVYQEVKEVMDANAGELTYDCLNKLKYTEAFIHESHRLYNFVGALERVCVKPYYIPELNYYIPEGMIVQLPCQTMMQDEAFISDPKSFNPDNYSEEAKKDLPSTVLSTASFGVGPRNCIAMRFAMMQVKLVVAHMIHNFAILPCDKTIKEMIPDPMDASLLPKGSLWVTFEPRM